VTQAGTWQGNQHTNPASTQYMSQGSSHTTITFQTSQPWHQNGCHIIGNKQTSKLVDLASLPQSHGTSIWKPK
jgi:hypothetical protein